MEAVLAALPLAPWLACPVALQAAAPADEAKRWRRTE